MPFCKPTMSFFLQKCCAERNFVIHLHRNSGGLAQLARALAWHARGHEFDSRILHKKIDGFSAVYFFCGYMSVAASDLFPKEFAPIE